MAKLKSDAEYAKWNEYAWLIERKNDLVKLADAIWNSYPLLETPYEIEDALELLEQAGDLLRRRVNKLDEDD